MGEIDSGKLEIHKWGGVGFKPLVSYGEWLVALMNWDQRFDLNEIGTVERHNETDEVFVLIEGKSILYVIEEEQLRSVDMEPAVLYNVVAGTWHNVVGTRDAKWLIVENNNTSYNNTEFRQLNTEEIDDLVSSFPEWLNEERG
jgi:mannose-6-phosphate isomerase-like protein (cupin superfamily)